MRLTRNKRRQSGFSLTEFILASGITVIMLGGVIYTHIMGQNLHHWSMTKVGANDQSREVLFRLQDEIRAAKNVQIGYFTNAQFRTPTLGQRQVGQTLRIFPTTNDANYVQYRLASFSTGMQLRRAEISGSGRTGGRTVATHLTNNPAMFAFEDFWGTPLTELSANRIVAVTLDFKQFQYPITQVGSNYYYDYYRLQTRISKRAVE
jgi:hypothetical protein